MMDLSERFDLATKAAAHCANYIQTTLKPETDEQFLDALEVMVSAAVIFVGGVLNSFDTDAAREQVLAYIATNARTLGSKSLLQNVTPTNPQQETPNA